MFNVCLWKMYVVVRTSVCACKRDKFLRDRVFDNNEVFNHLFNVFGFFSVRLLSVLRGHSADFIHNIYFPILILEKERVFSLFNV